MLVLLFINKYLKTNHMTIKGFIQDIIDDITVGGLLPMNIPTRRIEKVIADSTKMFIENDDRCTIENILFLDTSKLGDNCKIIKLPSNIKAVTRLEHSSSSHGIILGDEQMQYGRSSSLSSGSGGVMDRLSIDMYNQFLKMNSVQYVPYDYNEFTNELVLHGNPKRNIFMEVAVVIDNDAFYNMIEFKEYVAAKVTLEFVKANSFIKTKLVGGREINFDDMKESAKETLERIEDNWKEEQSNGVMLLD